MSGSNEAFEYFGSRLSGEKANFDVVDKVEFVSNALSLNVCTDLRRSDLGINNHNHVSPEEEKEVLERLSFSTRAANLHVTDSLTSDDLASNEIVTTCNRQKPADLVRRYCSKCELTVADGRVSIPQLCAKCGTLLDFQCTRCDKLYSRYISLVQHLESLCNRQNLDLKCPKCDYQTHSKTLMSKHIYHCTRKINYRCSHCEFKTEKRSVLLRHIRNAHKDMLITTGGRQKPADLIRRYCSKCKLTVAAVGVTTTQLCAKCGTPLEFQCIRCDKLYSKYNSILNHLESECNRRNLDLSCPKCDYRTHVTKSMKDHLKYCASEIIHRCSHCEYKTKYRSNLFSHIRRMHKASNEIVTTCNRQERADLIRRYCSKCELTVADVRVSIPQLCAKCGTLLDFQCTRCDKLYSRYISLVQHLKSLCDRQNLDLKCPKCDYQTHVKKLLTEHLKYCTSEINHRCSHCEYKTKYRSNLLKHIRRMHKDIYYATCSKCRGKPNKCHQCKNTELIWENFHVDFSSNDRHLEHYESCEK